MIDSIYNDIHAVALTVEEWLDLRCALHDAREFNDEKEFPYTARKIEAVRLKIVKQTQTVLDAAAAQTDAAIEEFKAA